MDAFTQITVIVGSLGLSFAVAAAVLNAIFWAVRPVRTASTSRGLPIAETTIQ